MKEQIKLKILFILIISLAINKQNLSQNIEWEQTKGTTWWFSIFISS